MRINDIEITEVVPFKQLNTGTVFMYEKEYFLKIITEECETEGANLEDGEAMIFRDDCLVTPRYDLVLQKAKK